MEGSCKILVAGSVVGNLKKFFGKIEGMNEKYGPFDALLCTGDFFGGTAADDAGTGGLEAFRNGSLVIPIPTYFIQGARHPLPRLKNDPSVMETGEFAPNLTFLGQSGMLTTDKGVRIAYLSGSQAQDASCTYSHEDTERLLKQYQAQSDKGGIDILLTVDWPNGICNSSKTAPKDTSTCWQSPLLADLVSQVKPRYHVVDGRDTGLWEREPFMYDVNQPNQVTRFISLATALNKKKQRWFYALNIVPWEKANPFTKPCPATEYPLKVLQCTTVRHKRARDNDPSEGNYFFDASAKRQKDGRRRNNDDHSRKPTKDLSCWFCLSNPKIEKHLILSIGDEVYLALAKGGLTRYHSLLIPIECHPSHDPLTTQVRDEMTKYELAVAKMLALEKCVPVFVELFHERNRHHFHAQVIPIPGEARDDAMEFMEQCAMSQGFQVHKELPADESANSYFHVKIPGYGASFFTIPPGRYDMQFGRRSLAAFLNLEDRADWKQCVQGEDKETEEANAFKKAFEAFEPEQE